MRNVLLGVVVASLVNTPDKTAAKIDNQPSDGGGPGGGGRNLANLAPVLRCGQAKIEITVAKKFLQRHGIRIQSASELHFVKNPECFAFDNDKSYTLTIFSPFGGCGTTVEHGSDDYVYSNEVVYTGKNNGREISVFQFRCIYEDKYIVSSGPLKPSKSLLTFESVQGEFNVEMDLYRASTFSFMDKHVKDPIIKLNEKVYVNLEYSTTFGWSDLRTTIKTCYATDQPKPQQMDRYHPLITGKCAHPDDKSVEIIENGESVSARFKFNMFKWKGMIAYIYLHCEVHLCNSTMEQCYGETPLCNGKSDEERQNAGRFKREAEEKEQFKESMMIGGAPRYRIPGTSEDIIIDDEFTPNGEMFNGLGHLDGSDEDYDLKGNLLSEMEELEYGEEVPEKEMSDFITRGPMIIDDDADVGVGSIETTISNITYGDDFLRIYIFSSIAVMICMIALILACLLALKRRRSSLEKVTSITQVFRNSDAGLTTSTTPDLGLASTGIEPDMIGKNGQIKNPRVLPAITGLPLPPTPGQKSGQGSSNESTTSSDDHSQRKLCKKSTTATTTTSVSQSHSMREPQTTTMPRYHGKHTRTNTKRTQSARIGLIEKGAKIPVIKTMPPTREYHQHSD
jgi:hypothetical protein